MGDISLLSACFNDGASIDEEDEIMTALMRTAVHGQARTTLFLLERKADVNHRHSRTGNTALMMAALNGNKEICQLLLMHGADPNIENCSGFTARDFALDGGAGDIIA